MLSRFLKQICLVIILSTALLAQENVKIMSYNLLNYPTGSNLAERNNSFKIVLDAVKPDLVVTQEIKSGSAKIYFIDEVLGDKFVAGKFIDGPDSDNMIFYKDSLFKFISNTPIKTALRDINEFKLVHKLTLDTLRIYSVHLKASSGSSNEVKRLAEVNLLRKVTDALPEGTNFLVCGDFNFYDSDEPGFQSLINADSGKGYVIDPINQIGNWHNNPTYQSYHTQSPRTTQFGGGSHGGLDDRFDFILVSQGIINEGGIDYVEDSYRAIGNDGNHFNLAINAGTNTSVSQEVANALHDASDHLPLVAEFTFDGTTVGINEDEVKLNDFNLKQNYPNPFNPETTISFSLKKACNINISVFDILGIKVATLIDGYKSAGSHSFKWNAKDLASGIYVYQLKSGVFLDTKKMILLK